MGISGNNLVNRADNIKLREVRTGDLREIVRIEKLSFPDPWTASQLLFEIIHEYSRGIVAEKDGRIVGYTFAMVVMDEGHIGNIAVDPSYRRMGIGRRLLRKLLADMEAEGVKKVFLEVRKSNVPAIRLYEDEGFVEIGIRKRYYRNREDAIIMKKEMC